MIAQSKGKQAHGKQRSQNLLRQSQEAQATNVNQSYANLPPFYRQSTQQSLHGISQLQRSRDYNNLTALTTVNPAAGGDARPADLKHAQAIQAAAPLLESTGKRSETSRTRNGAGGAAQLLQSQSSHSKILANLSRNFQEFKEDVRQLKENIGRGATGNQLTSARSGDKDASKIGARGGLKRSMSYKGCFASTGAAGTGLAHLASIGSS